MQGKRNRKVAALGTRNPLARSTDLVVEKVDGELLIYDRSNQRAHCLGLMAAQVFEKCDGNTDIEAIAIALEVSEFDVARAIEELEVAELLDSPQLEIVNGNGNGHGGITRRELTKRSAQIGGAVVAAPMILSITAPTAWAAATPPSFFCNIFTTQDCGASSGCGSIAGCCCCSKGCPGEGSCKGCTSVKACTGGMQVCANSNNTAGTDCSDSAGTNPFTKCGCCGYYPNIGGGSTGCGCGFGPPTDVDSNGIPTSGHAAGTTNPGSGCCDATSTGPTTATGFVPCTNATTCVPCCNGQPIYPSSSSEFGCCGGFSAGSPSTDACNHTPPTGYLPISC